MTRPTVDPGKARWVHTVDTGSTWKLSMVGHDACRSRHHLEVKHCQKEVSAGIGRAQGGPGGLGKGSSPQEGCFGIVDVALEL